MARFPSGVSILAVSALASCNPAAPRPRLSACTSAWTSVGQPSPNTSTLPHALAWRDGTLFLASDDGVQALPVDGGETAKLTTWLPAAGVWAEEDGIIYSSENRLYRVPPAGEDPALLLDGGSRTTPGMPATGSYAFGAAQILDSTDFYWTITAFPYDADGSQVWRMPRAEGPAEGFAHLPLAKIEALAVVPSGVLVAGPSTTLGSGLLRAFVAPSRHGAARELWLSPNPDKILAAEETALLYSVFAGSDGRHERHETWIAQLDGPSGPLSVELPLEFASAWALADGQGGHYLGGTEVFDDEEGHDSIFRVDPDGHATRLACDGSGYSPGYLATALSPDALFVAVWDDQQGWAVVRIAR
jgi:hypothetical protein